MRAVLNGADTVWIFDRAEEHPHPQFHLHRRFLADLRVSGMSGDFYRL